MELRDMLQILAKQDGSDLYLSTGAPPCAKFNGALRPLNEVPLEPGEVARIAAALRVKAQAATVLSLRTQAYLIA